MIRPEPGISVPTAEAEEPPVETLPSNCAVNIRGWENDNEAEAREFGEGVMSLAKELSRYLDLSRLESIVISWDYTGALASVDRGDGIPPAAPTANEYGQGGAMAVHVIRGDEIWNVVVIWTGLVCHTKPDGSSRAQAGSPDLCSGVGSR